MKKFFIAAILLTALLSGTACAEDDDDSEGATAAPPDINHADSIYFPQLDFYNMTSTDTRIILKNYPTYQQTAPENCGLAAALTVLEFFGNKDFDEMTLAKRTKTNNKIGTTLGNMVKFFKSLDWEVQSRLDTEPMGELEFQQFVMKNLKSGKPILVENIEFGGHWRAIIGLDTIGTENLYDDVLIFADPFDTSDHKQDGYAIQSLDRFFYEWIAPGRPGKEEYQSWLIATPKERT